MQLASPKIAMLGVGFLLEYLMPCVTHLVGRENLSSHVIGTTAQLDLIPEKQARLGIRIWPHTKNAEMLESLQPDIILFAPQPSFAPEITEQVLKPYYDLLREKGLPLPDLYACPPSPDGRFYRKVLGEDILVVNLLPNMITQIGEIDVARQGVTEITFPENGQWPKEKEERLREFFTPFGACVVTPPDVVFAYLGGQCTLHVVSELMHAVSRGLALAGIDLPQQRIASAMRAFYREATGYTYPEITPCAKADVPPALQEPIHQAVMAFFGGVEDACAEMGIGKALFDELFVNYLDLHLHSLQVFTREEIVHSTFQHATKGGTTEMALRRFYADAEYPLYRMFMLGENAADLLGETLPIIRAGAKKSTYAVADHGANLAGGKLEALSVEHHAQLYAMLVQAAQKHLGNRADAAIEQATWNYGVGRGSRMARRAKEHGIPLNMQGYFALREWSVPDGAFDGARIQNTPYQIDEQYLCPWNQAWKCFGKEKPGSLYCRNVDVALLHGFNPALRLDLRSNVSAGAPKCEFHYLDAHMSEKELADLDCYAKKLDGKGVKSFDFHTADLLAAFSKTLAALHGEDGQKAIDDAIYAFQDQYKNGAFDLVEAQLNSAPF